MYEICSEKKMDLILVFSINHVLVYNEQCVPKKAISSTLVHFWKMATSLFRTVTQF